jgi:hypothetical protein
MALRAVLCQLLHEGAITIVTTPGDVAPTEGGPLDAITVVQIDGDIITRIGDPSRAREHLAKLRTVLDPVTRLRRWLRAVDTLRRPVAVAMQVPWIVALSRTPGILREDLGEALHTHARFFVSVALGAVTLILQRYAPRIILFGLSMWAGRLTRELFSGRG